MTYLVTFKTKDSGNGYAIVNAPNARAADSVCRGLSRFNNLPDFKILNIEEFHTHHNCETGIMAEGITSAPESLYDIAVRLGFEGNEQQFLQSLKGEDGKDGKDFKFEDFTAALLELLKLGPRGPEGPRGYSISDINKVKYINNTSFYEVEREDGQIVGTFLIKDGDKGLKGDKGDKGDLGEAGPQGELGLPGIDAVSYNYYVTPLHINTIYSTILLKITLFIDCCIGIIPIKVALNQQNIILTDSNSFLIKGKIINSDYKLTIVLFDILKNLEINIDTPMCIKIELVNPHKFVKVLSVPVVIDGKEGSNGKDGANLISTGASKITIEDGYWVVNGIKTEYKVQGADGRDGATIIASDDSLTHVFCSESEFSKITDSEKEAHTVYLIYEDDEEETDTWVFGNKFPIKFQ